MSLDVIYVLAAIWLFGATFLFVNGDSPSLVWKIGVPLLWPLFLALFLTMMLLGRAKVYLIKFK